MAIHILGRAFRGRQIVRIGLASKVYGVGPKVAEEVCAKAAIYPFMRMHELTEHQIMSITKELSQLKIEGELKAEIRKNIQLKKDIGSYAGTRHAAGLPARGQNTQNNSRTAKRLNRLHRNA